MINGKLFVAHLFLVKAAACTAMQNVRDPAMLTEQNDITTTQLYR